MIGFTNMDGSAPEVDIVMPIRNEIDHLAAAVEALMRQDYDGRLTVIAAIGPSEDGTEQLAADLAARWPQLLIVENPTGNIPHGLNLAVRAGNAPIVVRVDGHSVVSDQHIRKSVCTLLRTGAANVGGVQRAVAQSAFEQAVVDATSSWLGTGGATYRLGGEGGPVDTVFLGAYDRAAIESVGLFDERLLANEDYELNIRLREAGHVVWFDPALSVAYRPRNSFRRLARQYFNYGRWKAEVLALHPNSIRARQAVPPLALSAVLAGLLTARRVPMAMVVPVGYLALLFRPAGQSPGGRLRTAGVFVVMHSAWSAGLAWGFTLVGSRRWRR